MTGQESWETFILLRSPARRLPPVTEAPPLGRRQKKKLGCSGVPDRGQLSPRLVKDGPSPEDSCTTEDY